MKVYTPDMKGAAMQQFDALPPRLRQMVRDRPELDTGFILVALDDGLSEDEVVNMIQEGRAWWQKA